MSPALPAHQRVKGDAGRHLCPCEATARRAQGGGLLTPAAPHRSLLTLPRGCSLQGWGPRSHPGPTCRPAVPRTEGGGRPTDCSAHRCEPLLGSSGCRGEGATGHGGRFEGPLYWSEGRTHWDQQGQLSNSSPHSKPPAESHPQLKRPGKQRRTEPADGVQTAGARREEQGAPPRKSQQAHLREEPGGSPAPRTITGLPAPGPPCGEKVERL